MEIVFSAFGICLMLVFIYSRLVDIGDRLLDIAEALDRRRSSGQERHGKREAHE